MVDAVDNVADNGSLDLTGGYRRSDRGLLAEAVRSGWPISPERLKLYFETLDECVKQVTPGDPKSALVAAQAARIYVMAHTSALKDLHVQEDRARMDAGKPTQVIAASKPPIDHDMIRKNILEGIDSDQ